MADALVSVVLDQIANIIRLDIEQELRLVVGVRKEVKKLTTTLTQIRAVLEDAEVQQVQNEAVKLWLGELKDIAYDADDILDEWTTRVLMRNALMWDEMDVLMRDEMDVLLWDEEGSRITRPTCSALMVALMVNKVRSYFFHPCSCFKPLSVRHNIAHGIKDIRERLDANVRVKDQLKLVEFQHYRIPEISRQPTSSIVDASEIHGRDLDKEIIMSRLLSETSHQEFQVRVPIISIVGMGGFGKTTLAQLVLQEENVKTSFELHLWVCVSEHFDLLRVAKEIIEQATGGKPDFVGWEALHRHLCESVKEKRFLLVLDDVWTQDFKDWNQLKSSLDGGAPGSKIIVTTRDEGVAKMMRSTYTHGLMQLADQDCWSVFRQIAFCPRSAVEVERSQEELEILEEIGMQISLKCKGVPLAAKTLGSLMCFMPTQEDWRNVLASDIWGFPQVEKAILPALLLSYHALPSNLKPCFMYCAIFPKNTKITREMLVKLWMSQGFIAPDKTRIQELAVQLEIKGGWYFNDLARRSFFQDFEKDNHGEIITCKMHDLVHDLAQFLTKNECYTLERNDTKFNGDKARHINAWDTERPSFDEAKNLRTLILRSQRPSLAKILKQMTCLRALDLSGSNIEELPGEVDKLLHLRYLDMSNTKLKELPERVCNLYNLQTLKLNKCHGLCSLPEEIGKLSELRHVEVEDTYALGYIPSGIGRLRELRTLSKFIVSASGGCRIRELGNLVFLRGDIKISGLRLVENMNEAREASLMGKGLRSLKLDFGYFQQENEDVGRDDMKRMEGVIEGLEPRSSLEELAIDGYPGLMFPCWISKDNSMVKLELNKCEKCVELPMLGNKGNLESLYIGELVSVKYIGPEFYGEGGHTHSTTYGASTAFPKLKKLVFCDMEQWGYWELPFSKYKNIMPCLCHLTLSSCPTLMSLPALGRLQSLESIYMNNLSRVRSVGVEFLGVSDYKGSIVGGSEQQILFPRLSALAFGNMEQWKEWDLPLFQMDKVNIMPQLRRLAISVCPNLKSLPALGKLQSLERLSLWDLPSVEHLDTDLLGIPSDGGLGARNGESTSASSMVLFPNLTDLKLDSLPEWEGSEEIGDIVAATSIMPCLHGLDIKECTKLKVVPRYMFSHALKKLSLRDCPQLTGIQPSLPPLLEQLELVGDVGVLSTSLMPINNSSCPNLKSVAIVESLHSSLPQGLNQLTSIQQLQISKCKFLDFETEELRQFPLLQKLEITECPILKEHCRINRRILSHIPNIITDEEEITGGI